MRAESGGSSRPLKLILMPSDGQTIPHLRDLLGSNTLLYIRPMKSCLPMDKPPQPVTTQSRLTKCPKCSLSIPIMQLRTHSLTCSSIEVNGSDSNDKKSLKRSFLMTGFSQMLVKLRSKLAMRVNSVIARE